MSRQFAQDLRLARRKAGLTSEDVAHLLGTGRKEITALELGRKLPSLPQICELSLIYGRSFESLFSELMESGKMKLQIQLPSLPAERRNRVATFNRDATLKRIKARVTGMTPSPYEGA